MTIRLYDVNTSGNRRDGVRLTVGADTNVDIVKLRSDNNGGDGLNIFNKESIYETLNLPKEIDSKLLMQVLTDIAAIKEGGIDIPQEIIQRSGLAQKVIELGANITTIAANITTLASSPNIQNIIMALSS